MMGEESALSRSPTSFASDRFIKHLSNLSMEHNYIEDSPSLDNEMEIAKASLTTSLRLIEERGERLTARLSDMLTSSSDQDSLIVEACRASLYSEFLCMLDEAQLLLDNMGTGGDAMVTSWRVSLAQIRVDAYLESIETALDSPDSLLDVELADVARNLSTQAEDVAIRISPWNLSSLAFDVTVATPVQHSLQAKQGGLPLNLHVRAIQEIQAKDMVHNVGMKFRACKLYVERCVHDVGRSFRAGAGSVGDVLVVVRVSPMDDEDDACIKADAQSWESEVSRPIVKEARK